MDPLKKYRDRIDWLDAQIASLLNERMRAADQIGKLKKSQYQGVTDKTREANVLHNVETAVQHPVLKEDIGNIYSEIMKEARIAQQFSRNQQLPFNRIGIIGLGLIGGSICKAIKLKRPTCKISILAHPPEDYSQFLEEGWIDAIENTLSDLVNDVELIILSAPIPSIAPIAEQINRIAPQHNNVIVIDVASVKHDIVDYFERLSSQKLEFVGTHPMSGKETRGMEHSQATIFVDRPWVYTPHKYNRSATLDKIKEFIEFLGAIPICMPASIHDHQAAIVSHLPAIISKSYLDFVMKVYPNSMKIAGPGFQSFTRIALSNPEMRNNILQYNKTNIKKLLKQWLAFLNNEAHDE